MIEEVGSNSKGETSVICTKGRYAILCRKLEIYRETLLPLNSLLLNIFTEPLPKEEFMNYAAEMRLGAAMIYIPSRIRGSHSLTAVVMNVAIFWDIPPYANRRFVGTYHLHLQGRKSVEQETSV
jgi:hypothetical protein